MLCSYVRPRQIHGAIPWRIRGIVTQAQASQTLGDGEWLRADEATTRRVAISRKRSEQQDVLKNDAIHYGRGESTESSSDSVEMGGQSSKVARVRAPVKRSTISTSIARSVKPLATKPTSRPTRRATKDLLHNDLASYLRHAAKAKLDLTTTVHKGVLYEYIVLSALKTYNFNLTRKGQAGDRGRDLDGVWKIPGSTPRKMIELPTIVQCKAFKPQPSQIRELEGSNAGIPAGMNSGYVLRLLVAKGKGTKGVLDAVDSSKVPMGFVHVNDDGLVEQIVWNEAARELGLRGIDATTKWLRAPLKRKKRTSSDFEGKGRDGSTEGPLVRSVVLMVNRRVWRPSPKKPTTASKA